MFLWFGIYYSTARGFCKKHPLSPAKREKSLKKTSLFPFTRQKLPGGGVPSQPSLGGHSRLPARVMQPSGLRPSPTDAAAETGRWATSHRDVAAPEGEPSRCAAESLQKAKSRLPPWGRWTRVSEDGEGKLPAAPSHGLCGSAGGRPSQSPNGDSSPEGGAKSRLPLWGRCPRRGRRGRGTPPSGKGASLFP